MEVWKMNRRGFAKSGMAVVALTAFARRGDAKAQQAKEEKKMAGKVGMGVVRTTYLIDENGIIIKANQTISLFCYN